ncbi:MAG: polyamine ABC transporter substrate-binding protein [Alphaproteobacteria bacterium]|nr:polyamine ABC transporter substrate-binding protein [Alphaproteobacteria bacterium]
MASKSRYPITRRRLLKTGGTVAAGAVLGPLLLTERTIAQSRTVYVNTWGGSWTAAEEAAFFKPFTDATGIRVRTVAPVSYAKLKAQVQSGTYEWDITAINQSDWLRAEREGFVEPIDWTVVQKDKLFPDAVFANGIAYCALGTNLCYRKDKFPNGGPKSWADFWDVKKFPGNRSLYNNAPRSVLYALLADGVPHDKVYPLDVDRAFKKLDQIKPHIKVWWTQGNQSQQLIRDGEIDMMAIWNARASELAEQGVPVELVWNGAHVGITMWGVAKGAPNRKLAWEFIQFAVQAKPQAEFCNRLFYGPTNPKAYEFVKPEIAKQMPTWPENAKQTIVANVEWEAANSASLQERFTQWLAS